MNNDYNHESIAHDHEGENNLREYFFVVLSFILLMLAIAFDRYQVPFFRGAYRFAWYLITYSLVAFPVIKEAFKELIKGNLFTEFFLMSLATIGAIVIDEYPEAVAVMLFYATGELFQTAAIGKAKRNITALLDVRSKTASVFRNNKYQSVHPTDVKVGERIQIKVGEKIPLDGKLISSKASLNTAAITGESKPQSLMQGENSMAGSINLGSVIEVEVQKLFNDSSVARILHLVQNATAKKAKTELLIRKLAKIYTPIVVYLAIILCFIPYFFVDNYIFSEWLYRALIFLVISCPCALVISIPLGYFGGLGAASKNGILFKGARYLDDLTKVNTIVMDKTGTVTKGVFKISQIKIFNTMAEEEFMRYLLAIESKSTHPIAKAILEYQTPQSIIPEIIQIKEIAGMGLYGEVENKPILAGNKKLMDQYNVNTPKELEQIPESIVLVAIDNKFSGYVTIADEIKDDAKEMILNLKHAGIKNIIMLSGDKDSITKKVASFLCINKAKGGLLPEDKLKEVNTIKKDPNKFVAFIGDGINDAPVLAASDIGIAMGAMGSDVAIETADIIIQTDQPSKVITGIKIAKSTQRVI